jgi:siroheme synthase-like protein
MKLNDLDLKGKTVMAIGGGDTAYRNIQYLIDSGATIWVISRDFSSGILKLGETRKVALLKTDVKDAKAFVDSLNPKPYVLVIATGNTKLDSELAHSAKSHGSLIYAVDALELCDFTLP